MYNVHVAHHKCFMCTHTLYMHVYMYMECNECMFSMRTSIIHGVWIGTHTLVHCMYKYMYMYNAHAHGVVHKNTYNKKCNHGTYSQQFSWFCNLTLIVTNTGQNTLPKTKEEEVEGGEG